MTGCGGSDGSGRSRATSGSCGRSAAPPSLPLRRACGMGRLLSEDGVRAQALPASAAGEDVRVVGEARPAIGLAGLARRLPAVGLARRTRGLATVGLARRARDLLAGGRARRAGHAARGLAAGGLARLPRLARLSRLAVSATRVARVDVDARAAPAERDLHGVLPTPARVAG